MILDRIVAAKRAARARRDRAADAAARERVAGGAASPIRSLAAALRGGAQSRAGAALPRVIAEFKRRSPSAGAIAPSADAAQVAAAYARAGAAALSVLTDEEFFGGALADLGSARRATAAEALPLLRKDFVLDEHDLLDAATAGADAVLLIVRILEPRLLRALLAAATTWGLEALVEVHDERECDLALAAGARLVGVNHRNLDTLEIDLGLSARLAPRFPEGVTRVAESGLRTNAELREMRARGYHAVLVGEALMRQPDPGAALRALLDGPA